jgi:HD-GYP domain-containing protein (c-di-GMP phosphodiesterase class II)
VSLKGLEIDALGNSVFLIVLIEITDFLLSAVYMLLLYFLVIKSLANISDRPFSVSWRIFVLPPALFGLLYGMVSITVPFLMENGAGNIIYAFSIFISYIFIWAFYVIIKTITATAEALEAKDEVETLSVEVMEALAHTIDAKDEYTKGHSVRVAQYARMLAKRMGLPDKECENVYNMGLLHDIGKIGVPKEIINSKKPLSKKEFDTIKIHPGLGYDILAEIKSRPDLCIGARWHHERYDGGGYPDGKSGEDIPLQARIIAVADSYDAMTSNRSYRNYLPQEKVRQEMKDNAGTQFDPQIAEAMIAIIDEDTEYKFHE